MIVTKSWQRSLYRRPLYSNFRSNSSSSILQGHSSLIKNFDNLVSELRKQPLLASSSNIFYGFLTLHKEKLRIPLKVFEDAICLFHKRHDVTRLEFLMLLSIDNRKYLHDNESKMISDNLLNNHIPYKVYDTYDSLDRKRYESLFDTNGIENINESTINHDYTYRVVTNSLYHIAGTGGRVLNLQRLISTMESKGFQADESFYGNLIHRFSSGQSRPTLNFLKKIAKIAGIEDNEKGIWNQNLTKSYLLALTHSLHHHSSPKYKCDKSFLETEEEIRRYLPTLDPDSDTLGFVFTSQILWRLYNSSCSYHDSDMKFTMKYMDEFLESMEEGVATLATITEAHDLNKVPNGVLLPTLTPSANAFLRRNMMRAASCLAGRYGLDNLYYSDGCSNVDDAMLNEVSKPSSNDKIYRLRQLLTNYATFVSNTGEEFEDSTLASKSFKRKEEKVETMDHLATSLSNSDNLRSKEDYDKSHHDNNQHPKSRLHNRFLTESLIRMENSDFLSCLLERTMSIKLNHRRIYSDENSNKEILQGELDNLVKSSKILLSLLNELSNDWSNSGLISDHSRNRVAIPIEAAAIGSYIPLSSNFRARGTQYGLNFKQGEIVCAAAMEHARDLLTQVIRRSTNIQKEDNKFSVKEIIDLQNSLAVKYNFIRLLSVHRNQNSLQEAASHYLVLKEEFKRLRNILKSKKEDDSSNEVAELEMNQFLQIDDLCASILDSACSTRNKDLVHEIYHKLGRPWNEKYSSDKFQLINYDSSGENITNNESNHNNLANNDEEVFSPASKLAKVVIRVHAILGHTQLALYHVNYMRHVGVKLSWSDYFNLVSSVITPAKRNRMQLAEDYPNVLRNPTTLTDILLSWMGRDGIDIYHKRAEWTQAKEFRNNQGSSIFATLIVVYKRSIQLLLSGHDSTNLSYYEFTNDIDVDEKFHINFQNQAISSTIPRIFSKKINENENGQEGHIPTDINIEEVIKNMLYNMEEFVKNMNESGRHGLPPMRGHEGGEKVFSNMIGIYSEVLRDQNELLSDAFKDIYREKAYDILKQLEIVYNIKPSSTIYDSLVRMEGQIRKDVDAVDFLLTQMNMKGIPIQSSMVHSVMRGLINQGRYNDAIDFVQDTYNQYGVKPRLASMVGLLMKILRNPKYFRVSEAARFEGILKRMYSDRDRQYNKYQRDYSKLFWRLAPDGPVLSDSNLETLFQAYGKSSD